MVQYADKFKAEPAVHFDSRSRLCPSLLITGAPFLLQLQSAYQHVLHGMEEHSVAFNVYLELCYILAA